MPELTPTKGPTNVCVVLLDSLNRHMLGSYGGSEFATPNLDRFARERATRFTRHVTGSLPCMPCPSTRPMRSSTARSMPA